MHHWSRWKSLAHSSFCHILAVSAIHQSTVDHLHEMRGLIVQNLGIFSILFLIWVAKNPTFTFGMAKLPTPSEKNHWMNVEICHQPDSSGNPTKAHCVQRLHIITTFFLPVYNTTESADRRTCTSLLLLLDISIGLSKEFYESVEVFRLSRQSRARHHKSEIVLLWIFPHFSNMLGFLWNGFDWMSITSAFLWELWLEKRSGSDGPFCYYLWTGLLHPMLVN